MATIKRPPTLDVVQWVEDLNEGKFIASRDQAGEKLTFAATEIIRLQAAIDAYEAAQPDTHVLVPREPTEAMLTDACKKHEVGKPMSSRHGECPRIRNRRSIYKAMIAAHEGETSDGC